MFEKIQCPKFWFDVYIEGLFYNLVYPGFNKSNVTKILEKIKNLLITKDSSMKVKLDDFTKNIENRSKDLEFKKKSYNATEVLYKIVESEQDTLMKNKQTITFKEQIDGIVKPTTDNILQQLSRFN
jgi:hypothetical protein